MSRSFLPLTLVLACGMGGCSEAEVPPAFSFDGSIRDGFVNPGGPVGGRRDGGTPDGSTGGDAGVGAICNAASSPLDVLAPAAVSGLRFDVAAGADDALVVWSVRRGVETVLEARRLMPASTSAAWALTEDGFQHFTPSVAYAGTPTDYLVAWLRSDSFASNVVSASVTSNSAFVPFANFATFEIEAFSEPRFYTNAGEHELIFHAPRVTQAHTVAIDVSGAPLGANVVLPDLDVLSAPFAFELETLGAIEVFRATNDAIVVRRLSGEDASDASARDTFTSSGATGRFAASRAARTNRLFLETTAGIVTRTLSDSGQATGSNRLVSLHGAAPSRPSSLGTGDVYRLAYRSSGPGGVEVRLATLDPDDVAVRSDVVVAEAAGQVDDLKLVRTVEGELLVVYSETTEDGPALRYVFVTCRDASAP